MHKIQTKIISAFPGTGKTTFHKKYPELCLDSDSSKFSWLLDKEGEKIIGVDGNPTRNPEFPDNYINHIKENIGKYKYIFVSLHKEVRDALTHNCIYYLLVYPTRERKEEFLRNYKNRGNDENFIQLLDKNWDLWMTQIRSDNLLGHDEFWLENGQFIEDILILK